MSIEAMKQTLDLSTPTLREMVTRHAAAIDPRATLEDMPEALSFQIDMARALLKEFTAIQQAEAKTDEPVAFGIRASNTGRICQFVSSDNEDEVAQLGEYRKGSVAPLYTHPAPGVPDDVVRDAERYRWLADCNNYEVGLSILIDQNLTEHALGEAIDAAMTAAQAQKGQQ